MFECSLNKDSSNRYQVRESSEGGEDSMVSKVEKKEVVDKFAFGAALNERIAHIRKFVILVQFMILWDINVGSRNQGQKPKYSGRIKIKHFTFQWVQPSSIQPIHK